MEYDLVQLFAEHLQVKTAYIVPETFAAILQKTRAGNTDFATAGISITEVVEWARHTQTLGELRQSTPEL